MNIWNRPTRIPEIYGTLIFLGLIVYFFIMYAIGLIHVIELRVVNLLIMLGGVYGAMKQFRRTHDGHMNYFRALAVGTVSAIIGTSTFSVFLFLPEIRRQPHAIYSSKRTTRTLPESIHRILHGSSSKEFSPASDYRT